MLLSIFEGLKTWFFYEDITQILPPFRTNKIQESLVMDCIIRSNRRADKLLEVNQKLTEDEKNSQTQMPIIVDSSDRFYNYKLIRYYHFVGYEIQMLDTDQNSAVCFPPLTSILENKSKKPPKMRHYKELTHEQSIKIKEVIESVNFKNKLLRIKNFPPANELVVIKHGASSFMKNLDEARCYREIGFVTTMVDVDRFWYIAYPKKFKDVIIVGGPSTVENMLTIELYKEAGYRLKAIDSQRCFYVCYKIP